ncbi:MAG: hypothetical protein JWQ27_1741 [Ferruginibacter sp.]|nr:hypothetical protein [Ferruginibacter sp.]
MKQELAQIALLVHDYDEAIAFYTQQLNFRVLEDTKMSEDKRWVVLTPAGSNGCKLLLARASNAEQSSRVGNQTGGRVFLFLYTDDLRRDHEQLVLNKVRIVREPSQENFGSVLVFADLYGNLFDLIEPSKEVQAVL